MATLWQQKSSKPRKMQIIEIKRIRKYVKIKQISLTKSTTLSVMSNKMEYTFYTQHVVDETHAVFLCFLDNNCVQRICKQTLCSCS